MAKAKGKAGAMPFSPHIHGPLSVKRLMWDVVIALIPVIIASIYFFGMNSIRIMLISVITALVTEAVINKLMKRKLTILDGSAVITGLLFAFNLPPAAPWYLVVIGSMFAIAVVKWAFGGLGQNVMNPALGGRVFVLAAWSGAMINNWSPTIRSLMDQGVGFMEASRRIIQHAPKAVPAAVQGATNAVHTMSYVLDGVSSASPLNTLKMSGWTAVHGYGFDNYWNLFVGNIPGSLGETSALAILIGATYLIIRKVIFPVVPFVYIGTVALLAWIFGGLPLGTGWFSGDALYHILSGGLFLGAFFMATDYVTSPMGKAGSLLYAVLLGILTVIIRLWGGYPEGVSYSIVIMNFFVPLIDRYIKPTIYGHTRLQSVGGGK